MSFRNRCEIAGSQGRIDLSIPLAGGRDQKILVKDLRIAGHYPWQDQHWKTILSCYSRSPWFDHYRDDLAQLYQRPVSFLLDWNLTCFEWSCRVLGLPLQVTLTEAYHPQYDPAVSLDYRGRLVPKSIRETTLASPPVYRQVFEEITGFIPNLSILDLLFCEGQRARSLLAQVGPTS